jgi:predicted component of viral defense system (DUF524 family)
MPDLRGHPLASLRILAAETPTVPPYLLQRISSEDAREWGEERIQLLEGATYEYELRGHQAGARLRGGVFRRSRLSERGIERGIIEPGTNTGLLPVILESEDGSPLAQTLLEVRSSKLDYRQHYREMLNYIAERTVDLLLEIRASAMLRLAPNPATDPATLAQQFAFLQSILSSREFQDALQRILAYPHRVTESANRVQDIRKGFKPTSGLVRQLASRQPRKTLPPQHPLHQRLASIPASLSLPYRRETADTDENRFVKHVISQFRSFLAEMRERIANSRKPEDERLRSEIGRLQGQLDQVLAHSLFAEISAPKQLPLGSPVLQRRGGYRELLRSWLLFNLAARLSWDGGNDVYGSGKRDVATLYEYWVFFRLLDLLSRKFNFNLEALGSLVEKTADGFGLKLKTGQHLPVNGHYDGYGRRLNVRFSFNRTFVKNARAVDEVSYPASGSWTRRMRPDYTLSLWPDGFDDEEAERCELMVHLHFDAKYRIERIVEMFGDETNADLEEARRAYREGRVAKRDDLLKMHAYRDAIRRSQGAYVIYPGTETQQWRGYHELLPNLGAFALRPGLNDGVKDLSDFFDDVMEHLCNRAALRERLGYQTHIIQKDQPPPPVHIALPEKGSGGTRAIPLADRYVLAAWLGEDSLPVVNDTFYLCIPEHFAPDKSFLQVEYLLFYSKGLKSAPGMRRVNGLRFLTTESVRSALSSAGYSAQVKDGMYAAYDLGETALQEKIWLESELVGSGIVEAPSAPIILPMTAFFSRRQNRPS